MQIREAKWVKVALKTKKIDFTPDFKKHVRKSVLHDKTLMEGLEFKASVTGYMITFVVLETNPAGRVRFTDNTNLELVKDPAPVPGCFGDMPSDKKSNCIDCELAEMCFRITLVDCLKRNNY